MDVITILQASDPAPHQILHVILRWAKENRVTEQNLQQQLMLTDDDDEYDNNNIARMKLKTSRDVH